MSDVRSMAEQWLLAGEPPAGEPGNGESSFAT